MIDEETISAVGRNAPGRGVRLLQVAEVFEIGHDVAQAGGREAEPARFRQRARADRLAGRDVLHDDLSQDLAGPTVELVFVKFQFLHHRPSNSTVLANRLRNGHIRSHPPRSNHRPDRRPGRQAGADGQRDRADGRNPLLPTHFELERRRLSEEHPRRADCAGPPISGRGAVRRRGYFEGRHRNAASADPAAFRVAGRLHHRAAARRADARRSPGPDQTATTGRNLHSGALRADDFRRHRRDRELLQRTVDAAAPRARTLRSASRGRAGRNPYAAQIDAAPTRSRALDHAASVARECGYLRLEVSCFFEVPNAYLVYAKGAAVFPLRDPYRHSRVDRRTSWTFRTDGRHDPGTKRTYSDIAQ